MVAVFRRVSVDISPEFIENFPVQFDFKGMLKRICDDVGVVITIIGESYNLEGQWTTIGKAHNMLVSTLAVYGSSNIVRQEQEGVLSQGSRPFSALVEAAEAISRGVELQEQVQKELMDMEHIPDHEFDDFQTDKHVTQTCISDVNSVIKRELGFNKLLKQHSTDDKDPNELDLQTNNAYDQILYGDEQKMRQYTIDVMNDKPKPTVEQADQDDIDLESEHSNESYTDKIDDYDYTHTEESTNQLDKNSISKTVEETTSSHNIYNQSIEQTNLKALRIDEEKSPKSESVKAGAKKIYPCDECEYEGKTRNAIADHRRRVHKAELTKCDICKKIFPNSRYMKRHRLSHSDPKHECDICGKHYKVLKALKEHKKRHDNTYIKPEFKCDQCLKSFSSSYVLDSHVKSEHMGIKKSFLCQTCGKSFTTKHTLQQHVNVHIGARPYQCKECGKSFCYESALRDHLNIHEGTKKFHCTNCDKSFRQRSALKMHEKIHKDIKDFTCPECDRGFTQKQALQRHLRSHKGLKPFSCKFCLRKFGEASVIRRHLILVHKVTKDPANWREDIILHTNMKELGTQSEKNGELRERINLDQIVSVINHEQVSAYTTLDEGAHPNNNMRLPPVTAIHNFRPIESYTHELVNSDGTTQEQSANIAGHMNYSIPVHHDYVHTTAVPSSQYNYTLAPLEFALDTNTKSGPDVNEHHKSQKILSYGQPHSITLDAHPENNQNEKSIQYLQQTAEESYAVIDVGKLGKSLEVLTKPGAEVVTSNVIGSPLVDQLRIPSNMDPASVIVKETADIRPNESSESLEGVNMSQFYTYYSNLASQYMNIGQYSILPNAESNEHPEL